MNERDFKIVYGNMPESLKYTARELALASHEYIAVDIRDIKTSYIRLGFHLCECQRNKYYMDFGYDSLADYAGANFGLEKCALSRCVKVFKKFSLRQGGVCKMFLDDRYKDYSYSQLCEMVSMNDVQLQKIKPSMTVKEIRELKRQARKNDSEFHDAISQLSSLLAAKKKDGAGTVEPEQKIHEGKVATSQLPDPECLDDVPDAEYQELDPEEKVATSQLSNPDSEPQLQENEPDHTQPDLPALKNNDQRKDWLRSYKDWGLWYRDDHINVDYYKFDFDNGARLIVEMYHRKATKYRDAHDEYYYHLLRHPDSEFERFPDSETVLLDFFKDLQKKK